MNLDLTGKTAMVCGSTQGIGYEAAREIAEMGATVVLVARNPESLAKVKQELPTPNGQVHRTVVADFANLEQVKKAASEAILNPIHILVNNTGGPPGGPIADATPDEFLSAYNNHLLCNHILVQAVIPAMKEAGYGRIINVVSTSVKQPLPGLGVSNTTRAAVAGWSKTLAGELGKFNITVNNVLPGATMTARLKSIIEKKSAATGKSFDDILHEMESEVPMKRVGKPHEIAAMIAFLASPAAGYINGTSIPVDGGRTLCF